MKFDESYDRLAKTPTCKWCLDTKMIDSDIGVVPCLQCTPGAVARRRRARFLVVAFAAVAVSVAAWTIL